MKRTININIKGNAFQIEEDAYTILKNYLTSIKNRINDEKESQEIIDDIETRLSELFRSSCKTTAEIITETMVQEVIKIMGKPEDIAGEENSNDSRSYKESQTTQPLFSNSRKMYRDTDDKIIAGVCSGLGHYFNIDTVIFRVIFIILTISGITPLIYIAFWIAMPTANTMRQKIEMMGHGSNNYKSQTNCNKNDNSNTYKQKKYEQKQPIADKDAIRPIAIIIGALLTLISFISLSIITLSILIYPKLVTETDFPFNILSTLPAKFIDIADLIPLKTGILIAIGIPLLILFYWGICLIFNIKKGHIWIGILAFIFWIFGIGLITYAGLKSGRNFLSEAFVNIENPLKVDNYKTLYIKTTKSTIFNNDNDNEVININNLNVVSYKGEIIIKGLPNIEIHNSEKAHIKIKKYARGKNHFDAEKNASAIEFFHFQSDSILQIDKYFTLFNNALIRNQKVEVDIYIPENIKIVVDKNLPHISLKNN
ncbi:MAG: PspC domain-containing protein [Bacteroidales bacterium]|nr:PspC domain-containing protein [Bacteroidales bacterium]